MGLETTKGQVATRIGQVGPRGAGSGSSGAESGLVRAKWGRVGPVRVGEGLGMHWDSTLRPGPDRPSGARGAGAE